MPRNVAIHFLAFLVFACVTFAAPLRAVIGLCQAAPVAQKSPISRFATLTSQAKHAAVCVCATCPGVRGGGKCCCTGAVTAGEGYALRAVCDTAPDASAPVSPLPAVPLTRTVTARMPVFAPVTSAVPSAPRLCFAPRVPSPLDAPPRLVS